ncbi:nuclear pore protein-like protein [Colletotrichum kahawae]|uniref:Nuclear pore protein-like protein n=1 Tax=Colletotrichum kahawae TaxID=34407 RepID=A0AAD9XVQ6_COLKA|nr:nuclear pore protein-like protein [Colletotrichum kahawae]
MTEIVRASCLDDKGSLSVNMLPPPSILGGKPFQKKLVDCIDNWGPPDAVDIVREMRHKLVSIHFEPYIELYKSLISGQGRCRYRARVKPHLRETGMRCDSVALGSLVTGCSFHGIEITAKDPVQSYRGTVHELQGKLAALKIFVEESHDKFDHGLCKRKLQKYRDGISADNARKTAEILVLKPQHQARMEAQAKKSGIHNAP